MLFRIRRFAVAALLFTGCLMIHPQVSQAQTFAIGPAPMGYVPVRQHAYFAPVVPVQTYTTYYAPQVPVVTTPVVPVPTVSAYYVPTTVVAGPVVAPLYPIRRHRRVVFPVAPVVGQPIYFYRW